MSDLNAQQAAYRVGCNVRTILRHVQDGSLPAQKTLSGWRIRVADLEARYGTYHKPAREPAPARVISITTKRSGFKNHAQAARWLAEHGVNALTPKNWAGWKTVELTQAAVLSLALTLQRTKNYRITWRLRRCGRAGCVCADML
jgi:excisionase family DNA binding protein